MLNIIDTLLFADIRREAAEKLARVKKKIRVRSAMRFGRGNVALQQGRFQLEEDLTERKKELEKREKSL